MRIKNILYNIKYFFQKIFRKNHISDIEMWNCYVYLAKFILPRLKAFRTQKIHGYPNDINSISNSRTVAAEDDEQFKKELDNWLKIIDEMIFAFEYALYGDSLDKNGAHFYLKYFGEDPYKDILINDAYYKRNENEWKIIKEAHNRALKGFEYFGKYFLHLWD